MLINQLYTDILSNSLLIPDTQFKQVFLNIYSKVFKVNLSNSEHVSLEAYTHSKP